MWTILCLLDIGETLFGQISITKYNNNDNNVQYYIIIQSNKSNYFYITTTSGLINSY